MAPTGTMRAVFYQGARSFTPGKAAIPSAGSGEALLRVLRVGICGTDLHIFQGHLDNRVPRGGIIGHETLAEVVEAPADGGVKAGDRVLVEPLWFCGTCRACRIGAIYLCYNLKVLGVDLPGGMQEYWPVPVDRLLKVPDTLIDNHAALVEPLAVATHDVTRAGVKTGDAVLVFGGGPIGCLIALVCRHRGARVAVAEINPFRVDMLRRLGLEVVGPGVDPVRFATEWTEVVRVWGTISIVAIHSEPMPVNLHRFFARELSVHGSRLYTRAAWEEAIRLAASGAIPLASLVSRVIPLESLQEGMETALAGGPVMKVLVDVTA